MPLRVALVSTPFISVPPTGYGGTELVVAELARALHARGVEVVVYATGDSALPGIEIRSIFTEGQWPPNMDVERTHATWALRDIGKDPLGFDIVHVHTPCAVEMARLCPYPVVCTMHHDADKDLTDLYQRAPRVRLVAISRSQARREKARVAHVVHHGLDPSRFHPKPDQGYLLYLGRYERVKGVTHAIEVAERANLPLVMAGRPHDQEYYDREVSPLVRKHGVLEVGPMGGDRKAMLLARARALVFPVEWDEPFGLVMIEAMLSGVPVLALSRGAVPEVVDDGRTGVLCDDPTEMVAAARIAETFFDRKAIRRIAEQRWSSDRMARDYLRIYQSAIEDRAADDAQEAAAEG